MAPANPSKIRFSEFEANLIERKLYRNGQLVELQSKGFSFLAALLVHHGEVVSRTAIAQELWRGIFVQENQGLNSAVSKVRRALGDSALEPTYVQTIESQGYRFIHPVEFVEDDNNARDGSENS